MTALNTSRPPKIEGYDLETEDGCRAAYRAARFYAVHMSHSSPYHSAGAFDFAVGQLLTTGAPTPADWAHAARGLAWPCKRCAGTGRFITYVENGVPRGPGGPCFRCQGAGTQNPMDAHRNYWHDVTQIVRMA